MSDIASHMYNNISYLICNIKNIDCAVRIIYFTMSMIAIGKQLSKYRRCGDRDIS